jgi:hypothetical protein
MVQHNLFWEALCNKKICVFHWKLIFCLSEMCEKHLTRECQDVHKQWFDEKILPGPGVLKADGAAD